MEVNEVIKYIENLNQWKGNDEGWWFGEKKEEISTVMVCWMANLEAVQKAVQLKCNLIICHETPFFPYWPSFMPHLDISSTLTWKANYRKIYMLSRAGVSIYRSHGKLDVSFNSDEFIRQAGVRGSVEEVETFGRIVSLTKPIPFLDLAAGIKKKLGLKVVRIGGDAKKKVRRVGIAIGGETLLPNLDFCQKLVEGKVDVVTGGEFEEHSMQYFNDSDVAFIETGHVFSENLGLKKFAFELQKKFRSLKVIFHECPVPFSYF